MKKLFTALKPVGSGIFFLIPIAAGAVLLLWATAGRSEPERLVEKEQARALRVIKIQPTTFVPRATGFGEASPSQFFQAVAEVKGKLTELHPELKAGSFIREGELLVAIDTTDVELSIQRLDAEIARSEASLAELKATKENLEAALKIEQSALEVSKGEFERLEKLVNQSQAVSDAELDQQRRSVLAQQQSVQNLNNSLNLLPAQIKSAEATIAVSQANLAASQRDLERCRILAPFNCRVGPADLEINEFVAAGTQLVTAQSTDSIEVEAQFATNKLAGLIRPDAKSPRITASPSIAPQELLRRFFDVEATVRYGATGMAASRNAQFERLREQLDAQARTIGIVVSIEKPYESAGNALENGPPPVPGTYCEVELQAKPIEDAIVIPRSAIRGGIVYVIDAENRLHGRSIQLGMLQDDFAVVAEGLAAGEQIVVSDPSPAIEEMLVAPEIDEKLQNAILNQASGEDVPR